MELGTVQTGIGKVDPAQKFKCTTAARVTDMQAKFISGDILKGIVSIKLKIIKYTCKNRKRNIKKD